MGKKIELKLVTQTLFYTSLLAGGLLFSRNAISQYLERQTALQITQQPFTLKDLPVLTVCYNGPIGGCGNDTTINNDWVLYSDMWIYQYKNDMFLADTDKTKFFETDTRLRLWVAFIRDRVRDRDSEYALYESETETETLESRETRD